VVVGTGKSSTNPAAPTPATPTTRNALLHGVEIAKRAIEAGEWRLLREDDELKPTLH
jgi:hypothetical protein